MYFNILKMKSVNKRGLIVTILILILLSTITYARPLTDSFRGGLIEINNFFENEGYAPYATTIDFFFFALLFIAIYMMGARYALKEVKRPEQVIVILLGLMTAFLLVLGGWSATLLLPYMLWFLYLLLFLLWWWLLKGIKSKFWRFLLALLLTLLTIALLQGLFGYLTVPSVRPVGAPSFGGEFFRDFMDSLRSIDIGVKHPGVPDYLQELLQPPTGVTAGPTGPDTLPPAEKPKEKPVTPGPPPEKGFLGRNWWWILLVLLIGLGVLAKRKGWLTWDKVKSLFGGQAPTQTTVTAPAEGIQGIINEITRIIQKKKTVLEKIKEIIAKKKENVDELAELYHKALKHDRALWPDPESEDFKLFSWERDRAYKLIKLERELEKELKELIDEENKLIGIRLKRGKASQWFKVILKHDEKRFKEIIEEIERLEKETPLLFFEKLNDIISRAGRLLITPSERVSTEGLAHQWYQEFMFKLLKIYSELFRTLPPGYCFKVRRKAIDYFLIAKSDEERERTWRKAIEPKNLVKLVINQERWKGIKNVDANSIKLHFEQEENFFKNEFVPAVSIR